MKKILIVSSDRQLLRTLNYELSVRGYDVLTEKNAEMTFHQIKNFMPDVLIVDLILDDYNGGAISHRVKSDPFIHDLPVIILSDYERETHIPGRFGCDMIVQKNNDVATLIDSVHNLLKAKEDAVDY